MNCRCCNAEMESTRRRESDRGVQEWFDCPVCGSRLFAGEPHDRFLRSWLAGLKPGAGVKVQKS